MRVSRGRRDQRLQERLHLEPLDPGQRLELASRLGALATMPHHRLVEGLRPSVVQVRARVAEPPLRRPNCRTRPPWPGRRRRIMVPDRGWRSRRRQRGRDPRNSTTRPPGVEERRRVEEQEEEQDHRKDPGFARPIILASASSSRVGVLCEDFARFSFSRLGGGGLEYGGGHVGLERSSCEPRNKCSCILRG